MLRTTRSHCVFSACQVSLPILSAMAKISACTNSGGMQWAMGVANGKPLLGPKSTGMVILNGKGLGFSKQIGISCRTLFSSIGIHGVMDPRTSKHANGTAQSMPSVFVRVGYFSSNNSCVHGSLNPVNPCNAPSFAAADGRTGSAQLVNISGSASLTAFHAVVMEVIYVVFGVGSPGAGVLDNPGSCELITFFFWLALSGSNPGPAGQTLWSNANTNKYHIQPAGIPTSQAHLSKDGDGGSYNFDLNMSQ